jgi:hypothetical protein
MSATECCGTCRFMRLADIIDMSSERRLGFQNVCKRYPPTVNVITIGSVAQPLSAWGPVTPEEWCGEWQPRPLAEPAQTASGALAEHQEAGRA